MRKDLVGLNFNSSFLSCEKDTEVILKKLFIQSGINSDMLKKLLVINTKDCLENNENTDLYEKTIKDYSLARLCEEGYIRLTPRLEFNEHEEIKSYILISFDSFMECADNPEFLDCTVNFNVMSHPNCWDIGNYRIRPLKICGYIDGILRNTKLTGIGRFQFEGCSELLLSEDLCGYSLFYRAVHGSDDKIPNED